MQSSDRLSRQVSHLTRSASPAARASPPPHPAETEGKAEAGIRRTRQSDYSETPRRRANGGVTVLKGLRLSVKYANGQQHEILEKRVSDARVLPDKRAA